MRQDTASRVLGKLNLSLALRFFDGRYHWRKSALDRIDFDRLDLDAEFFEPRDCLLDFLPFAFERKGRKADLVDHAALADIRHDIEGFTEFPDDGPGDELRREHQPETLFV